MIIEHVQKDYTENTITVQYTEDYQENVSMNAINRNYPNTNVELISNNKPINFHGLLQDGEVVYKILGGLQKYEG